MGNKAYANNMFRLRGWSLFYIQIDLFMLILCIVAAQGFTVLAMVGGSLYYEQQKKGETEESPKA